MGDRRRARTSTRPATALRQGPATAETAARAISISKLADRAEEPAETATLACARAARAQRTLEMGAAAQEAVDRPRVRPCGADVLVVDDDADIRAAVQHILEAEDYAVVTAADGKQAL